LGLIANKFWQVKSGKLEVSVFINDHPVVQQQLRTRERHMVHE
jgi:hypothetical protein